MIESLISNVWFRKEFEYIDDSDPSLARKRVRLNNTFQGIQPYPRRNLRLVEFFQL